MPRAKVWGMKKNIWVKAPPLLMGLMMAVNVACTAPEEPPGHEVMFTVPRDFHRSFLDMPWPNDIDRDESGHLNLRSFPNPTASTTLDDYLLLVEEMQGYACNAAIYVGIAADLDAQTLPTVVASRDDKNASVQLIDIDPDSPARGDRFPLTWKMAQAGLFLPTQTLQVMPVLGRPLRQATRYALVVTTAVKTDAGLALKASPDLRKLLGETEPSEDVLRRPWSLFADLRTLWTGENRSISDIAAATVFTTGDHTRAFRQAADKILRENSATIINLTQSDGTGPFADFIVYEGELELDQFQQGTAPFSTYGSGYFALDDDGVPVRQGRERMPFALTVPRADAPPGGWPLALVAHGTGGWWSSFIGGDAGRQSEFLARAGWAALGISQPLHRGRAGYREGQEDLATFNFINPKAALGNFSQSALETLALARFFRDGHVFALQDENPVVISANELGFFGHSQGALTGLLALAFDRDVDTAMLSGVGGGFAASLLYKTTPNRPIETLRTVLSLPDDEDIDIYHPIITLLQTLVEPVEPLNFAPEFFNREQGDAPISLLMSSGLQDTDTPFFNHGPLALALHLPLLEPVHDLPQGFVDLQIQALAAPIQGNMRCAESEVTGAMVQYLPPPGRNGHFVVFDNPAATEAVRSYFASSLQGIPLIQP